MVKFKIDEKWIAKVFKEIDIHMKQDIIERFERIASGIIQDQIKASMLEELKKPEYKEKIEAAVKELLLNQEAKQLVASFIHRRY